MRLARISLLLIPLAGACVYADKDTGEPDSETISPADTDADADAESCSFSSVVCIEPNEPDNERWCGDWAGGTFSPENCPGGATGQCDLPAGGAYTAPAMAYYYYYSNSELDCSSAGGTYREL
jgi:hypothetical protein